MRTAEVFPAFKLTVTSTPVNWLQTAGALRAVRRNCGMKSKFLVISLSSSRIVLQVLLISFKTAITRSFVLIYTLSLLTLLTRIQLNLLGRRNYLSSVVSLASPSNDASTIRLEDHDDEFSQAFGNDFETNRRYLTFSWWLLHRGWKDLTAKVRSTVEEVFGALNPREDITLTKLSELVLEVRKHVEGATEEDRRFAPPKKSSVLC